MSLRCLIILAALALAPLPAAAQSSDPVENLGVTVRLVAGAPMGPNEWRAGLDIRLDEGWKTYWRTPGDSGIPPRFDWSGSTNLDSVAVLWPAPHRFIDGAGQSIGYKEDVVLPLVVRPLDRSQPVDLVLSLDFAVCEAICVPTHADLALRLEPEAIASAEATLIGLHEARVPAPAAIGAPGPLAVTAARFDAAATPPVLEVELRGPADAELFVEGPGPDWFFAEPVKDPATGIVRVPLVWRPKDAVLAGATLRLTLASEDGAIETETTLP